MKKLYLLIFFVFLFVPLKSIEAKVQIIRPTSSALPQVDVFTVRFMDPSPPITKAVEVIDTQDPGIKQLGIYPSEQKFFYTLEADGDWEYKAVGSNDAWAPIGSRISSNKILLRLSGNDDVDTTITTPEENTSVLPDYTMRAEKSSSSDGVIVIDVPNEQLKISKVFAPIKNDDLYLLSSFYKIESQLSDYVVEFYYDETSDFSKSIYSYDSTTKIWTKLKSYNDFPEHVVRAKIVDQNSPLILAIFEDRKTKDGIASFYDQSRYRYFDYKNGNFAASRDYPKGTKLKVTRLLSDQSIIIEVNDYGPELVTGRLIDLDISAFKQLGSTSAGLIYVKVEPYDSNF